MRIVRLAVGPVDLDTGRVERDGGPVQLTDLERRLLAHLVARAGQDVSQDEILQEVWGYAAHVASRAVTATTARLRAKIERDPAHPEHVRTVRGHGLRFEALARDPAPPPRGPDLDRFFGRERERGAVLDALREARLVTVTGPGGIGKTRLAREVAAAWPGEVTWCPLAGTADAAGVLRAVAAAVGTTTDALAQPLASAPRLLLLDDLDLLVDAVAPLARDWLEAAAELRILATSRIPLAVGGERPVELGPLDPEAAAALFADRAADPTARAGDAGPVLRHLDGMPLAIELAARLTDVLTLDELAARLHDPLAVLAGDRRDAPDRHRSVRAALAGSWAALDERSRAALATLTVFRGPFEATLAEAVLGATGDAGLDALRALRARSLLARAPDGRLQLYGLVRAFAAEHLGPEAAIRARCAHAEALARACRERLAPWAGPRRRPTCGGPPTTSRT